jgi:hypothetical protein
MKNMKYAILVLILILRVVPAFAQAPEENVLRDLGMMGVYAEGDLALNDLKQNDPLLQLRRFFSEAKLPLTSPEEKRLRASIDTTVKAIREAKDDATVRKANESFTKSMFAALTPDQQTTLRRYLNQQIMMRGGFPALKLILTNAQTPLTDEQETQISELYKQFNLQADQLAQASGGTPDKEKMDKLESQTLGNVVKLLTPAQRRSLASSRLRSLSGGPAPK